MKLKGTVSLEGIEFFAWHGLYDFERETGNTFIVDLFITTSYLPDELYSLETTVDYEKVFAVLNEVMQQPESLLETVAHKACIVITSQFNNIEILKIKIRKKNPPIKNANIAHSAFELVWETGSIK
ncbi:MAG TPA: dihydroneopterin aldolase [Bacteroidia bacterium]|nr:dihydroneopterin aldolase [Bacteroidia bacterium]